MLPRIRSGLILCGFILTLAAPARADQFRLGVYDRDDDYIIGVLRLALAATGEDHTIDVIVQQVPQNRALRDLADGTAAYNVFFSGYTQDREKMLRQINVPLHRGLLGYRRLAIRASDQPLFSNIDTLRDLTRTITVGAGASWPDVEIMDKAGFTVVTGPDDSLWPMLKRGRFTAFPRGLNEITPELARVNRTAADPRIIADPTVMIAYRFDSFFYTARRDEKLARILERGLKAAYENGSFLEYFNNHPAIRAALEDMQKNRHKIFWLNNPLLSDTVRNIPNPYWHTFANQENIGMKAITGAQ